MVMSEEDRKRLRELCADVERHADAVRRRDEFMTKLYDEYRADPHELLSEAKLRSPSQLYTAFHRYNSQRVRLKAHRPSASERRRAKGEP